MTDSKIQVIRYRYHTVHQGADVSRQALLDMAALLDEVSILTQERDKLSKRLFHLESWIASLTMRPPAEPLEVTTNDDR